MTRTGKEQTPGYWCYLCRRVTNSSEEGREMSRYVMRGEGCNVQDIVHVRPGNKSIIEHTAARRNQRQENKEQKDQRSEDEVPTPRVSWQSQRMLHLQQASPNHQMRLCLQYQWNWIQSWFQKRSFQKSFQKMSRTLLNWKIHP